MTAGARDLVVFQDFVGDRFFTGGLYRLFRKFVTEFTFAAFLIEFGIFKMAEVAGGLRHLEFFLVCFMLVAASAVDLLTFDLVFLFQVRLVHKKNLLGEVDFFGIEIVDRFSVTTGGHAAGIDDFGSRFDCFTTKLDIGESFRRILGICFFVTTSSGGGVLL